MFELLNSYLLYAVGVGMGICFLTGPLGSVIIWRRLSFFGDMLAHSALLGAAVGAYWNLPLPLAVGGVAILLALFLALLHQRRSIAIETWLAIVAHGGLALGLIALAFTDQGQINLMGYLFGDILAIVPEDLFSIYGGGSAVLAGLMVIWRRLVALTINEDLAAVEGIPVRLIHIFFMVLVALTVAVAIKIVGVLLLTALFIIPAATARRFARTPEQMASLAVLMGVVAVLSGIYLSFRWDIYTTPAIVVVALLGLGLSFIFPRRV